MKGLTQEKLLVVQNERKLENVCLQAFYKDEVIFEGESQIFYFCVAHQTHLCINRMYMVRKEVFMSVRMHLSNIVFSPPLVSRISLALSLP